MDHSLLAALLIVGGIGLLLIWVRIFRTPGFCARTLHDHDMTWRYRQRAVFAAIGLPAFACALMLGGIAFLPFLPRQAAGILGWVSLGGMGFAPFVSSLLALSGSKLPARLVPKPRFLSIDNIQLPTVIVGRRPYGLVLAGAFFLGLGIVGFVVRGASPLGPGLASVIIGLAFGGIAMPLIIKPPQVALDERGIADNTSLIKRRYLWNDIKDVQPVRFGVLIVRDDPGAPPPKAQDGLRLRPSGIAVVFLPITREQLVTLIRRGMAQFGRPTFPPSER